MKNKTQQQSTILPGTLFRLIPVSPDMKPEEIWTFGWYPSHLIKGSYNIEIVEGTDQIFMYMETKYRSTDHSSYKFEHWFLDPDGKKMFFRSRGPLAEKTRIKGNSLCVFLGAI